MTDPKHDRDTVAALVARALALNAEGATVDLDMLCIEHPDLRDVVGHALQVAHGIDDLHRATVEVKTDARIGAVLVDRYRLIRPLGRGAQLHTLGVGDGLDQGLAHTTGGAYYCDSDHFFFPILDGVRTVSDYDPEKRVAGVGVEFNFSRIRLRPHKPKA